MRTEGKDAKNRFRERKLNDLLERSGGSMKYLAPQHTGMRELLRHGPSGEQG